jgi:hypothetical protein
VYGLVQSSLGTPRSERLKKHREPSPKLIAITISMSTNSSWKHKSPLEGYEDAPPLPTTLNLDGKSLYNGSLDGQKLSDSYERFPDPIDSSNNGFDFHGEPNRERAIQG